MFRCFKADSSLIALIAYTRETYKLFTKITRYLGLQVKNNVLAIHHRNLQKLVIEVFKEKMCISPEIKKDIFQNEDKS